MNRKLYAEIASRVVARDNCHKSGNTYWYERHEGVINACVDLLPHGSGIDGTNRIELEKCSDTKLVFTGEYHAMNEHGYYDGWHDFKLTVRASLANGIKVDITGAFGKYSDAKDYIAECFEYALSRDVEISMEGNTQRFKLLDMPVAEVVPEFK